MFESVVTGKARMVKRIHKLLDEADAVCHYNGKKFDIPTLNKEFLLMDLSPPSPAKQVDLLEVAKKKFRLASNKLEFVAGQLGLGSKTKHKGMELWLGCMKKNKEDWKVMEEYNKQDVRLLEKVYDRLLPWIDGHPNLSVIEDAECCPKCASQSFQARGRAISSAGVYSRFQCNNCGAWFRAVRREKSFNTQFREAR
jgi:DNA polymerase elongation subunit (family B)